MSFDSKRPAGREQDRAQNSAGGDDSDSIKFSYDDAHDLPNDRNGSNDRRGSILPNRTGISLQKCLKVLGTNETLTSFESWRGTLMYVLSFDPSFAPFLISSKFWQKKQKNNPLRGLADAHEVLKLEQLLGLIANYCPIIHRNQFIKNSTSIDHVWQLIRTHFGFQSSGSNFLNLADICMEGSERPEDLYQKVHSFFEDNLLSPGCGISHHNDEIVEEEELTPTIENTICYFWLSKLNKDLPGLVKIRYGTELKTRTLASLKPEISSALPSLLGELGTPNPVMRASASNYRPNGQYGRSSVKFQNPRPNQNAHSSDSRSFSNSRNNSNQRRTPCCSICKNAGRPSNHWLSSCALLSPEDKRYLARARLLSALDSEMDDMDEVIEDFQENSLNMPQSEPQLRSIASDCVPDIGHVPSSVNRVSTLPSPFLNVFFKQHAVKFTLDTGATVNMIHESIAKQLGLRILPSSQIATQADGKSEITIVGETRFCVNRDNVDLQFEGLVAKNMDTDVLAGIPFLAANNISIHPAKSVVMVGDVLYPYGGHQAKASIKRVVTSIARASYDRGSVWPGEYFEASCDIDSSVDSTVAIEPHTSSPLSVAPGIGTSLHGQLRFVNNSDMPIKIKKGQHIAHVTNVYTPPDSSVSTKMDSFNGQSHEADTSKISINPDSVVDFAKWSSKFRSVNEDFKHVFANHFPGYNGKRGPITAVVNTTNSLPPQRKGRIPFYNRDKLVDLQKYFDDLEDLGVFRKPEDVGVNVEYVNPSFLVKKPNTIDSYRLVTSFGEVAAHCKPTPSLMPNVESTLQQIGQWKYLIKTDLAKAYYQIPLSKDSQKYCGVVTPFRGTRVYQRSAMGMPGSESALEELMSRIFGDLIIAGKVAKIADDLYCGSADSPADLLSTWSCVLQHLSDCDLRLSPSKTVILPRSTTILGWIWNQGTLTASCHQISPLIQCDLPRTVKNLRSFIGAYKALSKVIKDASRTIAPLDTLTAGRSSSDKVVWSESALEAFEAAKQSLKLTKTIAIPKRDDQLWIVTDGAQIPAGIGSTLYITRNDSDKPILAGFFSAKLKQHQPRWLPCEIEALSITASCNHFRPLIIQSSKKTRVLTDSKPCVQAYKKLMRGEFSASSRVQTFLTMVNHLNVSINHISGASNLVADFASRNAPVCSHLNCQICKFNTTVSDSVVFSIGSKAVGSFTNRNAWLNVQSNCPSLQKTKEHLQNGTRPSKKCTKVNDTKRYLKLASLARDGLLVVSGGGNPFSPAEDRIVIPREIVPGLLTSIHLQTDHPTPYQLKQVFLRNFACLDADRYIKENCDNCYTCASLKSLPKHINEFSTSAPSEHVGQAYACDVLKRAGQCILVSRESVSSYTTAVIIPSERSECLLDGVIETVLPLHPTDGPMSSIRVDPAPGFQHLHSTQPLKVYGMEFELGRVKNPNKNSVVDKAIQELENELVRIEPSGGRISSRQLTFAVSRLNSRIRLHGLSAYELMFRRSQYTASTIDNPDSDIISSQHNSRLANHLPSFRSQQPRSALRSRQSDNLPMEGSIVYLKNDRSKHLARERYIVVKSEGQWLTIQKFLKDKFCSKLYKIHVSECFTLPCDRSLHNHSHTTNMSVDEDDDDLSGYDDVEVVTTDTRSRDPSIQPLPTTPDDVMIEPSHTSIEQETPSTSNTGPVSPEQGSRRYPMRIRKAPSFLLNEWASEGIGLMETEEDEEEEAATP